MDVDDLILARRKGEGPISKKYYSVVKCHLSRLQKIKPLDQVKESDVLEYILRLKSRSTRQCAKNIIKFYLGIKVKLPRRVLDQEGNRIDPNRFVKNWMGASDVHLLFSNMLGLLKMKDRWSTLLLCCIQLGTALRMSDVVTLSRENVDQLMDGQVITIKISKVGRWRNKRMIKSFFAKDETCILPPIDSKYISEIARLALEKVSFPLKLDRVFFKQCLGSQSKVLGIRNNQVTYSYGCGVHELRRFTLSHIYNQLADNPERAKIISEFADHSGTKVTQRYIQNIVFEANV